MVKIQIELTDEENKLVDLFKAENSLETKEVAIKEIIKKSKECKHQYELLKELQFLKKEHEQFRMPIEKPAIKFVQRCMRCGNLMENVVLTTE